MHKFKQRNVTGALVGVLVIVGVLVFAFVGQRLVDNDEPESHYAEMHVETNDGEYCADFIADEVGQDQIEVTITNCGKSAFNIRHGKTRIKLNPDKDYSVRLPAKVNHFKATLTTLEETFLSKFTF